MSATCLNCIINYTILWHKINRRANSSLASKRFVLARMLFHPPPYSTYPIAIMWIIVHAHFWTIETHNLNSMSMFASKAFLLYSFGQYIFKMWSGKGKAKNLKLVSLVFPAGDCFVNVCSLKEWHRDSMKFVKYVVDADADAVVSVASVFHACHSQTLFVALTCRPSRKVALLLFIPLFLFFFFFFAFLFYSFVLVLSTASSCITSYAALRALVSITYIRQWN